MNNYGDFLPCKRDESSGAEDWSGFQPSPKCLDTLSIFLAPPWFVTSKPLSDTTLQHRDSGARDFNITWRLFISPSQTGQLSDWIHPIFLHCAPRQTAPPWRQQSKCFSGIQNPSRTRYVPRYRRPLDDCPGIQNSNSYSSGTWTIYRPSYTLTSDQQHFFLLWVRIVCQIC